MWTHFKVFIECVTTLLLFYGCCFVVVVVVVVVVVFGCEAYGILTP